MKPPIIFQELGKDALGFWILISASLCIGMLLNQLHDQPLPLIYASKAQRIEQAVVRVSASVSPVPEKLDHPQIIGLQEFRGMVEGKKAVILDARPEIFHRLGHVPSALSLPREDFENGYTKYKSLLESNKDQPIAIYCSGASCEDSDMVANALVKLAYHRVLVFKGGWDEWSAAKLPQEGQQ